MERPSHIAYRASQPLSRHLIALGLAASFPVAVLWGLASGMGSHVIDVVRPLIYVPPEETVKPETPPPIDPKMREAETTIVVPPRFYTDPTQPEGGLSGYPREATVIPPEPPPAGPDRAAVSIASTHTIPPYPTLARRLNAEGKVTLRLTVLTDGSVGMAEIVTSSGRSDLDEAARDWIVGHWTYKPALDKGQPVISRVVASIVFRLTNDR